MRRRMLSRLQQKLPRFPPAEVSRSGKRNRVNGFSVIPEISSSVSPGSEYVRRLLNKYQEEVEENFMCLGCKAKRCNEPYTSGPGGEVMQTGKGVEFCFQIKKLLYFFLGTLSC